MKKIVMIFFALFLFGAVYAQSADVITEMLETEEVTFGQVCYLSAVHQGLVSDDASYDEAINVLYDAGQIPQAADSHQCVVMANLAFIYAQMWNVKGGLFYKIFNGSPRYAFKQLKADGVISEASDPKTVVSGLEALNLYTSCAIEYGGMTLSTSD